ncbi:hypothetical protein FGE12_14915 [Aggregicoccus sp. 17bor-14]|uniref:hypothetical protein n=1 Tax=Myxococcaceae TaxID=31 RepID=UPI0012F34EF2|nr:hypothetical protein [Simulacricoccus sp. 17bor-14]MRI89443.1 hypothetical protein [Aggregicoccus sp. 17bor-14]
MSRLKNSLLVATLSLALPACQDPVDKAAKQRIFSPEAPPQTVTAAAQKLPPEGVADDPAVARRVLGMDAAEVTERLGPHLYTADLVTEWASGAGGSVKLVEKRTLRAGPGGVSGDFHGVMENSRDQGLEVLRVGGKVYARNRYGTFRLRSRDRGIAERTRAELTGALHDFDELFRGRLKLSPQGAGTHEGRSAQRYAVSLAPATPGEATPDAAELPAALNPRNGRDDTSRRRAAFFALREPRSLTGEVWVDAQTSVVLKATLDGRLSVPGDGKGGDAGVGEAELHMTLDSARTEIGKDPRLKPPETFLPDADKPQGIADALDRFGVPRSGPAKPDAGTPPGGAEPDEDDDNN